MSTLSVVHRFIFHLATSIGVATVLVGVWNHEFYAMVAGLVVYIIFKSVLEVDSKRALTRQIEETKKFNNEQRHEMAVEYQKFLKVVMEELLPEHEVKAATWGSGSGLALDVYHKRQNRPLISVNFDLQSYKGPIFLGGDFVKKKKNPLEEFRRIIASLARP